MTKSRHSSNDPLLLGGGAAAILLIGFSLGWTVFSGEAEIAALKARLEAAEREKGSLAEQARREAGEQAEARVRAERDRLGARLAYQGRSALPPPQPLARTFAGRAGDRILWSWKTAAPAGRTGPDGLGFSIRRADGLAGVETQVTTDQKPADTGTFEIPQDGDWIVTVRNTNLLDVYDVEYAFRLEVK